VDGGEILQQYYILKVITNINVQIALLYLLIFQNSQKGRKMKKSKRTLNINVANQKEKDILDKAISLLDKCGYTVCKKDDLVLPNQMESYTKGKKNAKRTSN
jgi:hypothetical protein